MPIYGQHKAAITVNKAPFLQLVKYYENINK